MNGRTDSRARKAVAALMFGLPLLAGCLLGPNYQRPQLTLPDAWLDSSLPAAAAPTGEDAASIANLGWWELFRDPHLQALIRTALQENQDLLIATQRVIEAQARVGVVRSALFPTVDATLDVARFEQSREAFPNNRPPGDNDASLYGLGAAVTWELDVFGRIRRSTESERARLLATEEGQRAVVLSLVAAVASSYVELRSADLRLEIARRNLESRAASLRFVQSRLDGGLTSAMDPGRAEAEYFRVQAVTFQLEQLVRLTENELSVLIGRAPGPIARGRALPDFPVAVGVPAGIPSQVLDRRPDLLAAEADLHSATARVGAAKALLFPRFALTADVGTISTEFDALFTGSSQAWSVASGMVQPLFNAGRNRRRVDIAESQMRQALYAYEKAVLDAFRDVEDGLVSYEKMSLQRGAQSSRVEAERKVVRLAGVRYEGGVSDYLEVLDAQRSLFSAEIDDVLAMRDQLLALIRVYKALGGGWEAEPGSAPAGVRTEAPDTEEPGDQASAIVGAAQSVTVAPTEQAGAVAAAEQATAPAPVESAPAPAEQATP